jgi:hypothetical protein
MKPLKIFGAFVVSAAILYGLATFITLQPDVLLWSEEGRVMYAFSLGLVGWVTALLAVR